MDITYDLHIHSCLSPCGDNDMTPNNILNMALLLGLDAIAVSDHNSALNLPALFKAAEGIEDIIIVPAIEVCTNEEVHILCLFPTLETVLAFGEELYDAIPDFKNDVNVFGNQLVLDCNDVVLYEEKKLLINAISFGIDKLLAVLSKYDGIAVPAHVDKQSNSIISSLGYIPDDYNFSCVEVKNPENKVDFNGIKITNSDAHYLQDISDANRTMPVQERTVNGILEYIKRGVIKV